MDHFHYKGGRLHAEDVAIEAIAAEVVTPFYCYATATLERHYKVFDEAFAEVPHRICYAVKANSNLAVLRTLARLGSGADVVSEGEIRQALAAGIPAEKIVFSGVAKTAAEMTYALKEGIFQFNVESEPELEALSQVADGLGKEAPVALRVNPDVEAKTHRKISTGDKESKFGIDIGRAVEVYAQAAKLPGIRVQGVSVHIGSQLTSLGPFEQAFTRVVEFADTLRGQGHEIRTLDLGGGIGVIYHDEAPPLPAEYSEMVKRVTKDSGCELMFEPGRMIAANAGILVTKVIYVKETGSRTFVIVDAGMNDLARPAIYGAAHALIPVRDGGEGAVHKADIVGPVCETGDMFARDYPLKLPKAGALMAFRTAGAYGAVMSNSYNARLPVPEVLVKGSEHAVVRPRPSYEDLLARDVMPGWLDSITI